MPERRPYQERWPYGSLVRVAPLEDLEAFMASYYLHHSLKREQLKYAGLLTTVRGVGFYHGGDALYKLRDTGDWEWLEDCLRDAWSEIPSELHRNAKVIGKNEVAWRGTDVRAVFAAFAKSGAAIVGVESVVFREAGGGPQVEAISDMEERLGEWMKSEPWERCINLCLQGTLKDLERNVRNPYGDDVWYIVWEREQRHVLP